MKLSNDISQEELAVFLEETDEELKLLDEDLILLEKSGVRLEIIQEIFRAAHTLKGSSAMLGYTKMSQTAHAMETLLDNLRNGNLTLNTQMINALLAGLDVLKLLREKLVDNDEDDNVDINPIVATLEKIAVPAAESGSTVNNQDLSLSPEMQQKMLALQEKGFNTWVLKANLDKNSSWLAVRLYQLITEISQIGEVLTSQPTQNEIETGKVGPDMNMLFSSSQELEAVKNAVKAVPDIVAIDIQPYASPKAADINADKTPDQQVSKIESQSTSTTKKQSSMAETVRVDVHLLDNLINLVGEMVIDRNRIRQISRKLEIKYQDDEVVETLGDTSVHMMKLVSDLQDNVLRARMQHIGTIFNGFPRLVRDLAQKANKQVEFIIEGQETELDRSIIEQLRDPLLHLLRNSVDHGIETPEKRRQAGKPEKGTIRLSAYHEQSHIIVCVSDDGAGIDVEKVKQSAIKKGFISTEAASRLTQAEMQNLIFFNGVSTAEKITDVSGRGVGMDVVKTNVANVGGSVSIDSKFGQGTTFKMRLPLTLATIDGILVSSGGLIYVVPISAIVEILRLKSDQIQSVMGKEVFRLRESVIPLVRFNQRFNQVTDQTANSDEINIIVLKVGDKLSGLAVDAVLEPQESVVKPLGKFIGSLSGISGATIMGDGQVALILDAATLIKES